METKNNIVDDPKYEVMKKFGIVCYYDEAGFILQTEDKNVDIVRNDDDKEIRNMMNDHDEMNGTDNDWKRGIQIESDS